MIDLLGDSGKCCPEPTPQEKCYIGSKIIRAIPMSNYDFKKSKGMDINNEEYCPGYKVTYEDGYVSWSPQYTFERAYREISNGEFNLLNK